MLFLIISFAWCIHDSIKCLLVKLSMKLNLINFFIWDFVFGLFGLLVVKCIAVLYRVSEFILNNKLFHFTKNYFIIKMKSLILMLLFGLLGKIRENFDWMYEKTYTFYLFPYWIQFNSIFAVSIALHKMNLKLFFIDLNFKWWFFRFFVCARCCTVC